MRGQESSVTANSASERLSSSVGTISKAVNQLPHIGGCRTDECRRRGQVSEGSPPPIASSDPLTKARNTTKMGPKIEEFEADELPDLEEDTSTADSPKVRPDSLIRAPVEDLRKKCPILIALGSSLTPRLPDPPRRTPRTTPPSVRTSPGWT